MNGIQNWVLSVVAAGLICGIAGSMASGSAASAGVIKLTSGIFLILAVLGPVLRMDFTSLQVIPESVLQEAEAVAASGREQAENAVSAVIKTQTEAYILDKAASLGLSLQVRTELSEDGMLPEHVYLEGQAAPAVRQRLQRIITEDLGIPKEKQSWIG